jgi:hypothetical protein
VRGGEREERDTRRRKEWKKERNKMGERKESGTRQDSQIDSWTEWKKETVNKKFRKTIIF